MEEEIILEKKYSISDEMFEKAFDLYQKKFTYPRYIAISAVMMIAAAVNIIWIIKGDNSVLRYVIVCACLGLVVTNLYNPRKIKKHLMEAVKKLDGDDIYRMRILPEKIIFSTIVEQNNEEKPAEEYEEVFEDMPAQENIVGDSEIYLNNRVIVLEKPDFFIVYLKKSVFYVIPKADFSEEEITVMQIHFRKQLGKNYRNFEK